MVIPSSVGCHLILGGGEGVVPACFPISGLSFHLEVPAIPSCSVSSGVWLPPSLCWVFPPPPPSEVPPYLPHLTPCATLVV